MIRKSAMLRVGGYRSEYQHVEDFDLWLRLIDVGRLSNLPETLLQYRQHPSSVCFRMGDVQKGLAIRALREARSRRGYSPDTAIDFCGMPVDGAAPQLGWAVAALGAGYRATALKHTRRALRTQPMSLRAWTILAGCVIPTALTQRVKASKPLRALSRWLHSPAP
jgi:hypothetical protein